MSGTNALPTIRKVARICVLQKNRMVFTPVKLYNFVFHTCIKGLHIWWLTLWFSQDFMNNTLISFFYTRKFVEFQRNWIILITVTTNKQYWVWYWQITKYQKVFNTSNFIIQCFWNNSIFWTTCCSFASRIVVLILITEHNMMKAINIYYEASNRLNIFCMFYHLQVTFNLLDRFLWIILNQTESYEPYRMKGNLKYFLFQDATHNWKSSAKKSRGGGKKTNYTGSIIFWQFLFFIEQNNQLLHFLQIFQNFSFIKRLKNCFLKKFYIRENDIKIMN